MKFSCVKKFMKIMRDLLDEETQNKPVFLMS